MAAFQDAKGFVINGGQFNVTQQHTNNTNPGDPFAVLLRHSAIEATHESATFAYAPKCKPGTRKEVISDIMAWATAVDEPGSKSMVWFSGPAGGGKTCIQREVARLCQEQGILAASYFFSTRVPNLDHEQPFIATLAHELSSSIPGLKALIKREIRRDPAIFQKSLEVQLNRLITIPLACLLNRPFPPQWLRRLLQRLRGGPNHKLMRPKLIVIDGLDECRRPQERVHILRLLSSVVTQKYFPLRIAVASRPEFDIRTSFEAEWLKDLAKRIRLEDYGCDTDIKDYLIDSLFDLRKTHPSASGLPDGWPSEHDMEALVSKASGQFIYASTVVNFLSNPRRDLAEMFKLVMHLPNSKSKSANPFAELDALYDIILHPPDVDFALLKRLLHGFILLLSRKDFSSKITPAFMDKLFCLTPGTTNMTFCDLHSILSIPAQSDAEIRFHHKSVEDYLLSPKRCGDLFQTPSVVHEHLFRMCAHQLRRRPADERGPGSLSTERHYSALNWVFHAQGLLDAGRTGILRHGVSSLPTHSIRYVFQSSLDTMRLVHQQPLVSPTQAQSLMKTHLAQISAFGRDLHRLCPTGGSGPCWSLCAEIRRITVKKGSIAALSAQDSPSVLDSIHQLDELLAKSGNN